MVKSAIVANYLPQYHAIPENNKWWGEGYTDWVAVRKAKPLFEGHDQPREPLGGKYYSLDRIDDIAWQVELARGAGIDAFGIYHYWFSSSMHLLDTPVELIRRNSDLDIGYMLIWDNASWKRTWSNVETGNDWAPLFEEGRLDQSDNGVLAELIYGGEQEWKEHFEYLLQFFRDPRYVRIGGKPVFCFFASNNDFPTIDRMARYWDGLASDCGLGGLVCMSKIDAKSKLHNRRLDYAFYYEALPPRDLVSVAKRKISLRKDAGGLPRKYDYNREWSRILRMARRSDDKVMCCGVVDYDDTPRRGAKGSMFYNASPELFSEYFGRLVRISDQKEKDLLFLSAWNEWGEGMYLEPDERNGVAYLEALRRAILDARRG